MRDSRRTNLKGADGRSWELPHSLEPIVRRVLRLGAAGHPLGPRIVAEVVTLRSSRQGLSAAATEDVGLVAAVARRLSDQLRFGDRGGPARSQREIETIRVLPRV